MKYLTVLLVAILFCCALEAKGFYDSNPRFLLITGCGRSGTTYMSNYLTASGLDIKHERLGKDGTVAWPMCVNSLIPWGPLPPRVEFEHVFHQVRHPLDVISSWFTNGLDHPKDPLFMKRSTKGIQDLVWDFIQLHVPEINLEGDFLTECAKYWYYWNLKAEQISEWRYQIENLENVLPELGQRLGREFKPELLKSLSKQTNNWVKIEHKITWEELEAGIPRDLFLDIQEMALRYGYTIQDAQ